MQNRQAAARRPGDESTQSAGFSYSSEATINHELTPRNKTGFRGTQIDHTAADLLGIAEATDGVGGDDTRLSAAWFGAGDGMKSQALQLLAEATA